VNYCGSCGEAGDGRFCRMCGTLLSPITEPARPDQLSASVPTQVLGTGPGPEFDSLFRTEDPGYATVDRTRVLAAPAMPDYRMAPPGTAVLPSYEPAAGFPQQPAAYPPNGAYPPPVDGYGGIGGYGGDGGYADGGPAAGWPAPPAKPEPDGPRKGVIYGTLGAVGVAVAVIIALLYFGTPGPAGNPATAGAQASVPAAQNSTGATAPLQLPSGLPVPTTPPPPPPTTPPPAPTTAPAHPNGNSSLPLSVGSTGSLVRYVQERLHQLGFYSGSSNGQFSQSTAVAVQRFQASAQVQGDPAGTVGRSTMTALVSAGSQPELRPGAANAGQSGDVKRLQEALDYAENAGLPENGKYDAATWTAVAKYQSEVGLSPTGEVTSATWDKLQSGTLAG
jgi:peptidoglycan hydrolase-like protein with peptidoglycan-binding domain